MKSIGLVSLVQKNRAGYSGDGVFSDATVVKVAVNLR